ncbi:MAG: hypothetical protein HKN49_14030 [Gammaproteobacteria bacterium]|nr:hypothetical protein [Gammaproteobacteria bacterium]
MPAHIGFWRMAHAKTTALVAANWNKPKTASFITPKEASKRMHNQKAQREAVYISEKAALDRLNHKYSDAITAQDKSTLRSLIALYFRTHMTKQPKVAFILHRNVIPAAYKRIEMWEPDEKKWYRIWPDKIDEDYSFFL